jgi:hypothetical protein
MYYVNTLTELKICYHGLTLKAMKSTSSAGSEVEAQTQGQKEV